LHPSSFHPRLLSPIAEFPSLDPMAEKEIIPFGVDLNKLPPTEDSLPIVPVDQSVPLTIILLKQVVIVPPRRSYGQSYFAQVCQPTLPPLKIVYS
jgi:hypothetical protein